MERFIAVAARAEHAGTPAPEAQNCREQLAVWEKAHPGIRDTAARVAAALAGASQERPIGFSAADFETLLRDAQDGNQPWWARLLRIGNAVAPHVGAFKEALAQPDEPPLAVGKYEVRRTRNAHGEVVVRLRMSASDASVPSRRQRVLEVVQHQLQRSG